MSADKLSANHAISPIREEDTQQSNLSTKHGAYSHTYSANDRVDLNGTVHSATYSEIYESATRESIDETHEDLRGIIYLFANMRSCTHNIHIIINMNQIEYHQQRLQKQQNRQQRKQQAQI